MSQPPRPSLDPPARVSVEGVEPHPHRVGHRTADIIVAGAAILLSLLSLVIAVKHGQIMKDLVSANSWPLLKAETGNVDQGKPVITLSVENVGVGPAIVKNFYAEYRGRRFTEGDFILLFCCGKVPRLPNNQFGPEDVVTSSVDSTVIKSGESRDLVRLERGPRNESVWNRLNQERFKVRYGACYCSVLGQCWESDLTGINPREVKSCPVASPRSKR